MTFFVLSTVLFSCSRDSGLLGTELPIIENGDTGYSILARFDKLNGRENRRLAYTQLSENERFQLWTARLEYAMQNGSYNNAQLVVIKKLKDRLNVNIFKESDEREIFKTIWFPSWIKESSKVLSDYQIYNLAISLDQPILGNNVDAIARTALLSENGSESDCFCALHSRWTCPSFSIPPSVSFGTCLKVGDCEAKIDGCGALYDDDCDGNSCPQDRE